MNYQETTDYLFNRTTNYESQGANGYKAGLETMKALDEHFDHPHKHFRSIHVAGTNGKGSVCHMLAALLQVCGYRVGLYTSPHFVDFSERIRVNGQPISEEYVVDFVEQEQAYLEAQKATFFEIATMMAFKYFADQDVDIAIVEVGLGGRLDSTNIITPIVSVITNISLDHTQLLGNSVIEIAAEKGGIIKPGVPVIIGEATPETRMVFQEMADAGHSPIVFTEDFDEIESAKVGNDGMVHYQTRHLGEIVCELVGKYQAKNMATVLTVGKLFVDLGYLSDQFSAEGEMARVNLELENAFTNVKRITGIVARWHTISRNPTVICDMGHNPGAWDYLREQLEELKCRELRIVFGMVEDKDIYGIIEKLPRKATYFFTKGSTKRAFPETSLKVFAEQFGLQSTCYPTVQEAYQAAREGAAKNDVIFVGGSAYVVADFLKTCI